MNQSQNKYHRIFIFCFCILILYSIAATAEESHYAVIVDSTKGLNEDNKAQGRQILHFSEDHFGRAYDVEQVRGDFLRLTVDSITGWIHKDAVLIKIKNQYPTLYAKRTEYNLTRKIMITNQLGQSENPARIPVYRDPLLTRKIGETTIFELRYLFNERRETVLIGSMDRLIKTNAKDVIEGWIDKKYATEWNNRIGLEFDKTNFDERRNSLGRIFDTERKLIAYRDGFTEIQHLYEEENNNEPMPYSVNRFPIHEDLSNDNYKVTFIGIGPATRQDREEANSDLREIRERAIDTRARLALLIDATKGMQKHMNRVKRALKDFIERLREDETINLAVAIAVYRDYSEGDGVFEIMTNFTGNYETVINSIDTIEAFSSPSDTGIGTYPEALFHGLTQALERLNWGDDSIEKYLILIGDHGNHQDYSQYPRDRIYSKELIKTRLDNNHISLYTIQVNRTRRYANYNEMFERQIEYLIGGSDHLFGRLYQGAIDIENDDSVFDTVYKSLKNVYTVFQTVKLVFRNPGYQGRFTQIVLDRYGIDPNNIAAGKVQATANGYVSRYNPSGIQQTAEKVLMSKKDVERLKVQISDLADKIFQANVIQSKEILERSIADVVRALTGDRPGEDEIIADFIQKKTGLPIQTDLLKLTLEELVDVVREDPEYKEKLVRKLREKELLLEQVIKEREINKIRWLSDLGIYEWDFTDTELSYLFSLAQPLLDRIENKELGRELLASQKTDVWLPIEFLP